MMIHCYIAITLASAALALAGYPYACKLWAHHSRRARLHRRLETLKYGL